MRLASGVGCWLRLCGRFAKHSSTLALAVFVVLNATRGWAQAPDTDVWGELAAANNLDHEGNTPFHVKIAFQLDDLQGKPGETGTVEEWWASPTSWRIAIDAPSMPKNGSKSKDVAPDVMREGYLVYRLMAIATHPVSKQAAHAGESIKQESWTTGKTKLNCEKLLPSKAPVETPSFPALCVEPGTDELRFVSQNDGTETVARNSVGKFRNIYVALNVEMSLLGHNAISGKIVELKGMDTAEQEAELPKAKVAAAESGNAKNEEPPRRGVTAGSRVHLVQPEYPMAAKVAHKPGKVILLATIQKDGSLSGVVPLATSDIVFDDAAVEAVRQWKYSPFLLNGQPVQVRTVITVNFVS
jgi:TonB family protein